MEKINILRQIVDIEAILSDLEIELNEIEEGKVLLSQKEKFEKFFEKEDKILFNIILDTWIQIDKQEQAKGRITNWHTAIMFGECGSNAISLIKEMIEYASEGRSYSSEIRIEWENLIDNCNKEISNNFAYDYFTAIINYFSTQGLCDLYNPVQTNLRDYISKEYKVKYENIKNNTIDIDTKKTNLKRKQLKEKIKLYKKFRKELKSELKNL